MSDETNPDGAAEREELLDELEENHERARREAAEPDTERRAREAKPGEQEPERKRHDEENPPHTTTGKVTSPKFGSAGSGGAEYEGNLKKN